MRSAAPDIRMSDPVREVLGVEGVDRVMAVPLGQAPCPMCTRRVPPAGPVNVVICVNGEHRVVMFCHTGCAPSTLMAADFDLSELLPDVASMNMTALLLPHGAAVLVAERPLRAWHSPGRGGELTDTIMSALLAHGFALVPRLDDTPRQIIGRPAVLAVAEHGLSRLLIEPADGDLFYDGTVDLPPGWQAAAARHGWCVLYSGSNLTDPATDTPSERALKAAAAAGTLAGARLLITWATAS